MLSKRTVAVAIVLFAAVPFVAAVSAAARKDVKKAGEGLGAVLTSTSTKVIGGAVDKGVTLPSVGSGKSLEARPVSPAPAPGPVAPTPGPGPTPPSPATQTR